MKTVVNKHTEEVILTFEGEDIVLTPDEPVNLTPEAAKFVLDTLGFCEETKIKKEVSVPKVPAKKEVKETKVEKEEEKESKE